MSDIFSTPEAKAYIASRAALIPRVLTQCVVDDVVVPLRSYSSQDAVGLTLRKIRQDAVATARKRYPKSGPASRFTKSTYHIFHGEARMNLDVDLGEAMASGPYVGLVIRTGA
jgi:hypothetical protein